MKRTLKLPVVAAVAVLSTSAARLSAQITEVSRTPIADAAQITFGYLCDDRFVIRNDGTKPIDLEYGLEKGTEHTKLTLNARESVELASSSKNPMELWMDGKLIAKAMKEKRSCKEVQGNASVHVNPLEVSSTSRSRSGYGYGPPYPFYDPWYFGFYGMYGFRPYYGASYGYPIIIGRRVGGGGHRR
ncbi:MAG: hypothetical protein U0132_18035 [Gemmatimonadaceae bacterium]